MSGMNSSPTTRATRIQLFSLRTPNMRVFHVSWLSFFLCFFGWFGIAPLMAVVREDLGLTQTQVGHTIIASVAITVLARLGIGWLCDRVGPRITYSLLLGFGSLPVLLIGLANSYESFLLFRLAIGVIGASFVITQYHTTMMFAPNVVGTANATTAGWGNLGGGVTQMVMPLVFAGFVALGYTDASAWRLAMVVPGFAMLGMAFVYWFCTQDYPEGNLRELSSSDPVRFGNRKAEGNGAFRAALRDYRVWGLFLIYGATFGVELTINNIAAIYYMDHFDLNLRAAGLIAGLFGAMNLFARSTGGFLADWFGMRGGLRGRVRFLFLMTLVEGIMLVLFSQMTLLPLAIGTMILFSICVQMAEGATFAVVPFVNRKAVGAVSGIVGAGGNVGAVLAGFLFAREGITYPQALLILGAIVIGLSFVALTVHFSTSEQDAADRELESLLAHGAGRHVATGSTPARPVMPGAVPAAASGPIGRKASVPAASGAGP